VQKQVTWLHISDIHFSSKTAWRHDSYREALLRHLESQFESGEAIVPDLIFCTGDIAFGETSRNPLKAQYEDAMLFLEKLRKVCSKDGGALPLENIFLVPGNHDIDRSKVNQDAQMAYQNPPGGARVFFDRINQRFNDKSHELNDAFRRLEEYSEFVRKFLPHQYDAEGSLCYAVEREINGICVGIGGFNSAWSCSGPEDDRNIWLGGEWQFNYMRKRLNDAELKIGLIHHPTDWMSAPEQDLANRRISTDFDFWLHGHVHNSWVSPLSSHVIVSAGAIGADQTDEFGFNLTTLDLMKGKGEIRLNNIKSGSTDWTIYPIGGHAPKGIWNLDLNPRRFKILSANPSQEKEKEKEMLTQSTLPDSFVHRYFTKKLDEALRSFSTHNIPWVNRILSTVSEVAKNSESAPTIDVKDIISSSMSILIKAPAQYGLTSLARYLVKEAWDNHHELWMYLDAKSVAPHNAALNECIADELQILGMEVAKIRVFVVDSWSADDKGMVKLLGLISDKFPDARLLVMQQINNTNFMSSDVRVKNREFFSYYLWSLSRHVMRDLVACFNEIRPIGDEDAVTTRLTSDLDVLNLHRTPLNCITLLKVSEIDFEESPVNRSDIIKRVLFLLFNVDEIPTYKSKPDLKDCEFVLGAFCESLMRNTEYIFSRDKFLSDVQKLCKSALIDLETDLVFDVLYRNNIIIKTGNFFKFKFAYWIYYFAAQRMHHSPEFATYIFDDMRYSQYPEIIEFYTGIDRRRNDALQILTQDILRCHDEIRTKLALPDDINPYKFAIWKPSPALQEQMQQEIAEGVLASNLPASIKDQFADKNYDRSRPYDQEINNVLSESSFINMIMSMSAGARALRNSDYATTEVKRELLKAVTSCWVQATRVLFSILPILAKEGYAVYDGIGFVVADDFEGDAKSRFIRLLTLIPSNVMSWNVDDLYSRKLGPLLTDRLDQNDVSEIERHELILLLIAKRPRDWDRQVQRYIINNEKNSYYLMDVYEALGHQHSYGFASPTALKAIEYLIKFAAAKHLTGEKSPNSKAIAKVKIGGDPAGEGEISVKTL
jgi:predicted phosphodiesterase